MAATDRRTLLQSLAAASIAPHIAFRARAIAAAPPNPRGLGFSLYAMKNLPLDEALSACAQIGYDSVELALMPGYPSQPQLLGTAARRRLRNRLSDLGLSLPALMDNFHPVVDNQPAHLANLERIKHAAALAHELSPQRPPVLETVLGGRPAAWDSLKHQMAERLGQWAETAAAADLTIAVKPHVGGALHTPEGARWLLAQVDSPRVKLVYDFSHYELRGLSLEDTMRALLPDTVFIHVKDTRGNADKFEFLLPGQGHTDYVAYFRLLDQLGYAGPLVVEVSGQIHGRPGYDPLAAARQSYAALAAARAAA